MTTNIHTATETARTVVSSDGATISYLTVGSGPSVIVIPGALSMAADYADFARALAGRFTVHTIERRGRGASSPQGEDYSMLKEVEDVLALQRETGASAFVGHSFGGLVALEAARKNPTLTNIAVYEPGVSIDGSIHMDWIPGYKQNLAERKLLDAFIAFTLGVGPERIRSTPRWLMKLMLPLFVKPRKRQQMLGLLQQNLREHQEVARLDSSYKNYGEIAAGVLFMYGGKSDSGWVNLSTQRLAGVIPHFETRLFPKLNHFGIDQQAPRDVARAVSDYFLSGTSSSIVPATT